MPLLSMQEVIGLTSYLFETNCGLFQIERLGHGCGVDILMWQRILMNILVAPPIWIPEPSRILTLVYNHATFLNCYSQVIDTRGLGLKAMDKFGNGLTECQSTRDFNPSTNSNDAIPCSNHLKSCPVAA
ncbi:hypothetical protein ACH5RR_000889 [Cinchona calisaya]|uniref:Uncharacterized protein n=1 Tax=Cinchona calisaya TaxID=153742 RepID=A0ABD3B2I1_9GENT